MALSRDVIYYTDFADEKGNEYSLHLVPSNCDSSGNPTLLSNTPTYVAFPRNMILNKLSTKNEYADRGILPIGLQQRNELQLQIRIDRTETDADDWYALLGEPLSFSTTSPSPVFGQIPTRIASRDVEFLSLTASGGFTLDYVVTSLSSEVVLDVDVETFDTDTFYSFKVATASPDSAFEIIVNTYWNGEFREQFHYVYVIGNPAGYNSSTLPQTTHYGNLWRLWKRSGSTRTEIRLEGMRRRVPPVKKIVSAGYYDFELTAVDVVRCALEQTSLADIRAKLTHRATVPALQSISSAENTVTYTLRNGERYHMYNLYRLFEAIAEAAEIHLKYIRRTDKQVNLYGPAHVKFYDFNTSTTTVPAPTDGYSYEHCSFIAFIGSSPLKGGVLSDSRYNADESWEKEYTNAFDLLTDIASSTASKYVVRFIVGGGTASGITLYCYKPFGLHYGQTAAYDLSYNDFLGELELIHGDASIRGVSAEVSQPHGDDKQEYKESIQASERDDELAPKILLHNIPTYNPELITNTLFTPIDESAPFPTIAPLSDVCKIDLGNSVTIGPARRLVTWEDTPFNRDQAIAAFQNKLNYATELCKVLTSTFGSDSLLTINGKLLTSDTLNTARVGSAYNVTIPGGRVVFMILVSCSEDCVSGICDVTLIGIDPQA